jgi:hypothetical protein
LKFLSVLAKNGTAKVNKKIVEFRIGQLIYNPQFIRAIAVIDRPLQAIFFGGRESFFSK